MRYLYAEADVRYWEDARIEIDGQMVDDEEGTICGRDGNTWKVTIDLQTGQILNWDGRKASIHYKVCDAGLYWILNENFTKIMKYNDYYVPKAMCYGGNGYGDYIIFDVNSDGYIEKFTTPVIKEDEWETLPLSSEIKIEWLDDDSDCDDCGAMYAHGAKVYRGEDLILDMSPAAACYDGDDYTDRQVYDAILEKLGFIVSHD